MLANLPEDLPEVLQDVDVVPIKGLTTAEMLERARKQRDSKIEPPKLSIFHPALDDAE
jgi:hypothetical protein